MLTLFSTSVKLSQNLYCFSAHYNIPFHLVYLYCIYCTYTVKFLFTLCTDALFTLYTFLIIFYVLKRIKSILHFIFFECCSMSYIQNKHINPILYCTVPYRASSRELPFSKLGVNWPQSFSPDLCPLWPVGGVRQCMGQARVTRLRLQNISWPLKLKQQLILKQWLWKWLLYGRCSK